MTRWQYKVVDIRPDAFREGIRNLSEEGYEGWEIAAVSFNTGKVVLKRQIEKPHQPPAPALATQPIKEEVKPMKFTGYRTVLAFALYIVWTAAGLLGFTGDIDPVKKDAVDKILLGAAGIYGALKINGLKK